MATQQQNIGEVLQFFNEARRPVKSTDRVPGPFPYLGASGTVDYVEGFTHEGSYLCVSEDGANLLTRSLPIAWVQDGKFWANNHLQVLGGVSREHLTFFRYAIESTNIAAYVTGSAQPKLSKASLSSVKVPKFSRGEEERIGKLLSAIDDKIAANSRIIKIATHLNINLVEKAVTKELEHLQNLADITMGSSPKGEFLNEEGIGEPFFQGVRDFGELFPSERVFAEKAVRTAQEGDILFAVRAPIGEVNIAERPCIIGRGIAAIRGKQSHLGLFYLLKGHPELWETYQSSGTVFAGINKSDLHNAVIPVLRDSEKLEQQLTPIHERAMHALRENQVLARTRDELLPLLMSGHITVGEAEEAVDVAGTAASES